ncbi:MAG: hypothetical protein H6Q59_2237 [Firmicutes bacterium]|nr:hypothetical protein [Bacillota bacterium]
MNDKKISQMSGNISDLLAERLGQQMSTALAEALYPEISRIGQAMEQMAQDIKHQNESGIHTLADSFFTRMTQQTTNYNTDIIENIRNSNNLQHACTEQSEKLIERLEEKSNLLMDQMKQEREEYLQYRKQSFELTSIHTDIIRKLQENQDMLSSRLDQMQEQFRVTDGQLKQAVLMTEKMNQGQELLNLHTDEMLKMFNDCQRQWVEDIKSCNSSLERQSQSIRSNLETTAQQMNNNLEASSQALLEASINAKSCIEILDRSFTDYQQKLDENINDVFGVMDQHLAGISKSLGQSAEEIAAASKAVPRAMRSVIEEMKQAAER